MYYEVKPHDPEHTRASQHVAIMISDYMRNLGTFRGVGWAQNSVLLALLDGAATIAASMSIPVEECLNYFRENYRNRELQIRATGATLPERRR